jgi:hypothetical protein
MEGQRDPLPGGRSDLAQKTEDAIEKACHKGKIRSFLKIGKLMTTNKSIFIPSLCPLNRNRTYGSNKNP